MVHNAANTTRGKQELKYHKKIHSKQSQMIKKQRISNKRALRCKRVLQHLARENFWLKL